MSADRPNLQQYTVQQLQLELIRRCGGERSAAIIDFLLAHHDLWLAVLADEIEYVNDPDSIYSELPLLTKLADVKRNQWHAKTLWVLTVDEPSARRLFQLGKEQSIWSKMWDDMFLFDAATTQRMIGSSRDDRHIMAIHLD